MSCKHCKKEIVSKFITLNVNAALMDNTETWIEPPKNTKIDLSLSASFHHVEYEMFQGHDFEYDVEVPKEVDILSMMCNYDNISKLGDKQAEENFCSKDCLVEWFKSVINKLPN